MLRRWCSAVHDCARAKVIELTRVCVCVCACPKTMTTTDDRAKLKTQRETERGRTGRLVCADPNRAQPNERSLPATRSAARSLSRSLRSRISLNTNSSSHPSINPSSVPSGQAPSKRTRTQFPFRNQQTQSSPPHPHTHTKHEVRTCVLSARRSRRCCRHRGAVRVCRLLREGLDCLRPNHGTESVCVLQKCYPNYTYAHNCNSPITPM